MGSAIYQLLMLGKVLAIEFLHPWLGIGTPISWCCCVAEASGIKGLEHLGDAICHYYGDYYSFLDEQVGTHECHPLPTAGPE